MNYVSLNVSTSHSPLTPLQFRDLVQQTLSRCLQGITVDLVEHTGDCVYPECGKYPDEVDSHDRSQVDLEC